MKTIFKTATLALLISTSVGFAMDNGGGAPAGDGAAGAPAAAGLLSYLGRFEPQGDTRIAVVALATLAAYKVVHGYGATPVCNKLAQYLPESVGNVLVGACNKCKL